MWICYLIIGAIIADFLLDSITTTAKKMRSKEDPQIEARLNNIEQYLLNQNKKK